MLAQARLTLGLRLVIKMNYFAHTDDKNIILGWYTDAVHQEIPEPNVAVSRDTWADAIERGHNKIDSDGVTSFADARTDDEKASGIRSQRSAILRDTVDPIAGNTLRWNELTGDKQGEVAEYRTKLLGITDQSDFPHSVIWPDKPEWM